MRVAGKAHTPDLSREPRNVPSRALGIEFYRQHEGERVVGEGPLFVKTSPTLTDGFAFKYRILKP